MISTNWWSERCLGSDDGLLCCRTSAHSRPDCWMVFSLCADMGVDMCVDMYADMCVDMCLHVCVDRCVDKCVDMCVDTCVDMCVDICVDMCVNLCVHKCADLCADVFGSTSRSVYRPQRITDQPLLRSCNSMCAGHTIQTCAQV